MSKVEFVFVKVISFGLPAVVRQQAAEGWALVSQSLGTMGTNVIKRRWSRGRGAGDS